MLDLEAKLSSFRKMVWDEEKDLTDEELFKSTEINSNFLEKKNEELKNKSQATIKDRRSFLEIKKNETISSLEESAKNDFYSHKEKLLEGFYKKLVIKLIEYKQTDAYKKNLSEEVYEVIKSLKIDKDDVLILLTKDDLDLVDLKNKEIMDDSFIGGFMVSDLSGSFRYNFSYKQKIKENSYEFGKKIYQILESESENETNN